MFCVFGNAALAGMYALTKRGIDHIAFVDWDVHLLLAASGGFKQTRALPVAWKLIS